MNEGGKIAYYCVSILHFCLQNFQTCHVVPFESEVSAMTELVAQLTHVEKHTPVEELCRCVRKRYDWLVFSVARLYVTTQECCRIATEFEQGEGGIAMRKNERMHFVQSFFVARFLLAL